MKTTEIIVKSVVVSECNGIADENGVIIPRVRVEFNAPVPQKRKQADGSYADVEGNTIEMKASALRAKLYQNPLIADAKRNSGTSLSLPMINSLLEAAKEIKVIATKVDANEEYEGVIYQHEGFAYKFDLKFTDDDVTRAAEAAEKRKNRARAFLGI